MPLKLLQLNIYKGSHVSNLIDFLKREDFDIVCMQEVAGGQLSASGKEYNFEKIRDELDLEGKLNINWRVKTDPTSYDGNSIFWKKEIPAENYRTIFMKPYEEMPVMDDDWAARPRSAAFIDLTVNDKKVTIGTTHMAWGPNPYDEPYKENQAKILRDFLDKIENPLILTGDFNLISETQIVKSFLKYGKNLTSEKGITNTLNPRTHRVKKLFPKGLAVDFIFVSEEIKVVDFRLVDELDLSDHFGLSLVFEV